MSKKQRINFDSDPDCELGNTHLTIQQVADEIGVNDSFVREHISHGMLQDCAKVRVIGTRGGPIAVEYDATLHHFLTRGRLWNPQQRAYTRQCKAQELHVEGWTPQEIADALGVTRGTVYDYLKGAHDQPDVPDRQTPPWEQPASSHGLWPTDL